MGGFSLWPEVGKSQPQRLTKGLEDATYWIGRDRDCDLVCADCDISGKHAEIEVLDHRISITDISRIGSWVNGFKLDFGLRGKIPLLHGDRINLGSKRHVLALDSIDTLKHLGRMSASLPSIWLHRAAPELTIDADARTFKIRNTSWMYLHDRYGSKWAAIPAGHFDVLLLLHSRRGQVCRYEEIQRVIDTRGGEGFPKANEARIRDESLLDLDRLQRLRIRTLIRELRQLIGVHRSNFLIRNMQGVGYTMAESRFLEEPPFKYHSS